MLRGMRPAQQLAAGCAIVFAIALSGCTVFDDEQRRTLNWLDESLAPESAGARYALLPVAVPVGFVALTADAVVVNPVMSIDDAWLDTRDLLWTRGEDVSNLRRVLVAPFAAAATPIVFAGNWLGRCLFPFDPYEAE